MVLHDRAGRLGAVAFLLASFAGVSQASAEDKPPFSIGARPGWFLNGGVTSGGTIVTTDRGGFVGGELSLTRMKEGRWMGIYGDGYYEFGIHKTYSTAGLELGYKFLGIDGGAAARIGGAHIEWGPTGRLLLTMGILSLYGRYAYFPETRRSGDDHVVQLGALVKLPLVAWISKTP